MWVWSRWWWFSQCGCCPLKRSSRVDENSRSCTDVASYPAGRSFFFFFLTPQTFPWERCWEQLSGKKWDETNKNDWPHYFWMMSPFLRDCWAIEAAEVFFNIFSKLFWWAKTQKQSFIHMFGFLLVHFWPQRWRGIVELPLTHTLWTLTSLLIINLKDWSITAF